ncbi:MAG: hypothetical protein RLZZ58_471 [Pseudomonadota bacterium]
MWTGHRANPSPLPNDNSLMPVRLAIEWLFIMLLSIMAAAGVALAPGGQQLSNWLFDQQLAWSDAPTDPRIMIAQIDEQSLASIGRWPWDRRTHAAIIDRLADANVAAIGYDVLFTEPADDGGDAALAAALARAGRVAIPAYIQYPGLDGRAYDVEMPVADLVKAARSVGHVNALFDSDGQVRRAQMQFSGPPRSIPHLMQGLARDVTGKATVLPDTPVVRLRPTGTVPAVAVDAILRGEVPASLLSGKIILVGATAQGMGDLLPVSGPAGSVMPGVEVQANILNAILADAWIRDAGPVNAALVAAALLLLVAASYWRVSPNLGLLITLGVGVAALGATALALAWLHIWLTPLPLLVGLLMAYPLWNWRRLSALNSFVASEARALDADLGLSGRTASRRAGLDSIALAAGRLRSVIGELRDRRHFLRDVIEAAPDALCVVDPQGRVMMANEHAKQLFGGDAEGAMLQPLLGRLSRSGSQPGHEIETGDGRTMLINSAAFTAAGDARGGHIVRLADISDRRAAERARDEALEFLSHDMRAPQAGIVTLLDGANPDDMPAILGRIRGHADRALKLADDFVQLAKLRTLTPERMLVDLRGVFEEAIDGVYDLARARGVTVRLTTPDELPPVMGDSGLLVRAVGNLIGNAVKYGKPGGAVDCALSIGVAAGGPSLLCCIDDDGPGIPPDRMAALFERFGASDGSVGLSAGLGLAFVKRAVEMQAGTIACTSDAGGTRFRLAFPVAHDGGGGASAV